MRDIIKSELAEIDEPQFLGDVREIYMKSLVSAYDRNLMMDADDAKRWNEIGWYLFNAQLYGPAGFAFHTCTKIDVTSFGSWVGLGACEIEIYRLGAKDSTYPIEKAQMYLGKAYDISPKPDRLHYRAWSRLVLAWKKIGNEKAMKKCAKIADSLDPKKKKK